MQRGYWTICAAALLLLAAASRWLDVWSNVWLPVLQIQQQMR
jgi:hypothetical protein